MRIVSHAVATAGAWTLALGVNGRLGVAMSPGDAVVLGGMTGALAATIRARDVHLAALWAFPFVTLVFSIALVSIRSLAIPGSPTVLSLALPALVHLIVFRVAERALLRDTR